MLIEYSSIICYSNICYSSIIYHLILYKAGSKSELGRLWVNAKLGAFSPFYQLLTLSTTDTRSQKILLPMRC